MKRTPGIDITRLILAAAVALASFFAVAYFVGFVISFIADIFGSLP